jgi:hypothetical protein
MDKFVGDSMLNDRHTYPMPADKMRGFMEVLVVDDRPGTEGDNRERQPQHNELVPGKTSYLRLWLGGRLESDDTCKAV